MTTIIDVPSCSAIEVSLLRAFAMKKKRGWDRFYVAVDLHDTIVWSTYTKNMAEKFELFPGCADTLRFISGDDLFVLILFTSSYVDYLEQFYKTFEAEGIHFKYLNENPECPSTQMGDYSHKFYYNLLIDDKAGFNPLIDWNKLKELFPIVLSGDYSFAPMDKAWSTFLLGENAGCPSER